MTLIKKVIPVLGCKKGKLLHLPLNEQEENFPSLTAGEDQSLVLCHYYSDHGADALLIQDLSETDLDHEKTIHLVKHISREIDIPIIIGGNVKTLEDVKKYLYAGAQTVYLDASIDENIDLMKEASDRFGSEKIYAYLSAKSQLQRVEEFLQLGASMMILEGVEFEAIDSDLFREHENLFYIYCANQVGEVTRILQHSINAGVLLHVPVEKEYDLIWLKHQLKSKEISVDVFESALSWEDFKLNSDGHIPVVIQDYKTMTVLMMAYMNKEAFEQTIATGIMTYFSRSRQALWVKGETSGHTQYLKELMLDCDHDTLLAKVRQIGPACHTGSKTCFFETLVKKEYQDANPLKVFEDVYATIKHRREFPKEGSYTNYLFDKGLDKILKKLGEEATEIVIASKNLDAEEIKYEISDFLYHMMVLMAEKNITWEEITKELSNRS